MKRVDIFSKKYYTDFHNVDEDVNAISVYGGYWIEGELVGVTDRNMCDSSTTSVPHVASPTMKNWSVIIRMRMMSTKIQSPSRFKVGCGSRKAMWVSRIDI